MSALHKRGGGDVAEVFISYHVSPGTSALVCDIVNTLESKGISCWYAPRNVVPGNKFVSAILEAIDGCSAFLIILDEGANGSEYVLRETLEAFNRYKAEKQPLIIPFQLGTFPVARELNFYLRPFHMFNGGASANTARTEEVIDKISSLIKPPTKILKRGGGDTLRFTLDANGLLTIFGSGSMRNFQRDYQTSSVDTLWWNEREAITEVKIQNGVTTIGQYAFYGCKALKSVTIPDSVTTIRQYTFYGCAGLTSVTIPDSVTTIGSSAFSGCAGLISVTIPDSVTTIGSFAFYG